MRVNEKTGMPEFEAHEFTCECPKQLQGKHWDFCKGIDAANDATEVLHEWLKAQPVVQGYVLGKNFYPTCAHTHVYEHANTHTACLVGIRKLEGT